jgi:hypothetical protein
MVPYSVYAVLLRNPRFTTRSTRCYSATNFSDHKIEQQQNKDNSNPINPNNMNSSSYDRPIEFKDQSPSSTIDKVATSITTRVDEDNKAHGDAADRASSQTTLSLDTPSSPRPPAFLPSMQNAVCEDGFNARCEEHASLDDNVEELPMSLYLPNLDDITSQDKNARRGALRVGGNSFLAKPLTYYEH